MERTGLDSRKEQQIFVFVVRTDTGPTQPHIQKEPELLLGLKRTECEVNCPSRYFAKLEKSGAKHVISFYAFMLWVGTNLSLLFVLRASDPLRLSSKMVFAKHSVIL